ncbi:MAG TPA: hypothetical protein VMT04_03365, partial [Terriglobales bacterium]|nr:hypothetical protein [Terriglobales bacterium]
VPNGPILGPLPIGYGSDDYYCIIPPPNLNGIGIWIVQLEPFDTNSPEPLPVAPAGGRAVFNPHDLRLSSQPLLIIRGEGEGEKRCPDLLDISGNKNCFGRDETGTFTVGITDPDSALCGYTWEFSNTITGQEKTRPSSTNTISITFDSTWDGGNWAVRVSAILCNAPEICGYSITADNIYEFGLLLIRCPVIDYLEANPDTKNRCKYRFEVSISGDYIGSRIRWDFGDGSNPEEQDVTSSIMTKDHTYSNVPANGVFVSVELIGLNVCCTPQKKERWITLPDGGCSGGGGTGGGGGGGGDNEGGSGGGGGFSLCGFLLTMWIIGFLTAGILGYLNQLWPAGAIAYAAYAVFLGLWIGFCCWPCASRFWKCCTLLQWHFIVTTLLLQIFAVLALSGIYNPYVTAVYTLIAGTVLTAMLALGRCRIPNVWNPSDYPGSKCERR